MNRRAKFTTVAIVALLLAVGAAVGVAAERFIHGAYRSHYRTDEFRMSIGVTASGNPDRVRKVRQTREVINVPEHFGTLVRISEIGERTIFWYQSANGRLRNVIVEGADIELYALQSTPVQDLRVDKNR
jgi:hypothetical protein